MDGRLERLREAGIVRRGHFVLPDGRHADATFDRDAALEDPSLFALLIDDLVPLVRAVDPQVVTGASPGGMVVASQVAMRTNARLYYLEFAEGASQVDPWAELRGERVAVFQDFVADAGAFDDVVRIVRSRGAEVVALGAAAAMPVREADLPLAPFLVALRVEAQIFSPEQAPEWLANLPVEAVSG